MQVNIHEAKTQFSRLLGRVIAGEEIIVAKAGKPIARIVPYESEIKKRTPDEYAGQIWISDEFNAPLPDDLLDAFEGT